MFKHEVLNQSKLNFLCLANLIILTSPVLESINKMIDRFEVFPPKVFDVFICSMLDDSAQPNQ